MCLCGGWVVVGGGYSGPRQFLAFPILAWVGELWRRNFGAKISYLKITKFSYTPVNHRSSQSLTKMALYSLLGAPKGAQTPAA